MRKRLDRFILDTLKAHAAIDLFAADTTAFARRVSDIARRAQEVSELPITKQNAREISTISLLFSKIRHQAEVREIELKALYAELDLQRGRLKDFLSLHHEELLEHYNDDDKTKEDTE